MSSNFLGLFGFEHRKRYDRTVLGNGGTGFSLSLRRGGVQQIYRRRYSRRRSNPFETQVDIPSGAFLKRALPQWAERVHVSMRAGEIVVRPVPNHTFHIRRSLREASDPFAAFVALSSGVDAHCIERTGFKILGLIEWRPPEARDHADLSETGVLTSLANTHPDVVFNEDITTIDMARVIERLDPSHPVGCLHLSIVCDDHSSLKGSSLKQKAIEDGTSARDMVYDALRLVETMRPATVVVEQVGNFRDSPEGILLRLRLRRWGYNVDSQILDARDFGGYTSRRRLYLVASVFPGFQFPATVERRSEPIWGEFTEEIARCRDITHCKSAQEGIQSGRALPLTPDAPYASTVAKSQARQTKDSLYLKTEGGRILAPTEAMLKRLNEIPDSFNLDGGSGEIAIEQIGQSISYRMHEAVMASLRTHLAANNTGRLKVVIGPARQLPLPY
jgi:DNA (cytosine-5)-methyltransferase 1